MLARLMDPGKWFYAKVKNKEWEGNWLKIDRYRRLSRC